MGNPSASAIQAHSVPRPHPAGPAPAAVVSELRAIQSSLLPSAFPAWPERTELEIHAVALPARLVTGDLYDFFFLPNGTLVVLVADVSGKGVPAGLIMAVTRTLVRDASERSVSPGETLGRVNAALRHLNLGPMFVTMFLGWYDTRSGRLRYANAGHPLPYRIDRFRRVAPWGKVTGTVLGVLDQDVYAEGEGRLEVGERLVLYTDGVAEACRPDGEFFGEARFAALLNDLAREPVDRICQAIATEVDAFQGETRSDDLTLLVLGRRG